MNVDLKQIEALYGEDLNEYLFNALMSKMHDYERENGINIILIRDEARNLRARTNSSDLAHLYPLEDASSFDYDVTSDLQKDIDYLQNRSKQIEEEISQLNDRTVALQNEIDKLQQALDILNRQQQIIDREKFSEEYAYNEMLINTYTTLIEQKKSEMTSISEKIEGFKTEQNSISSKIEEKEAAMIAVSNHSKLNFDLEAYTIDINKLAELNEKIAAYNKKQSLYLAALEGIRTISQDPDALTKLSNFSEFISTTQLEYELAQLQSKLDLLSRKTNYDVINNMDLNENDNSFKANYVVTVDYFERQIAIAKAKIVSLRSKNYVDMDDELKSVDEIANLNEAITRWKQIIGHIKAGEAQGKQLYFSPLRDQDIEEMRQLQVQIESINDRINRLNQIKHLATSIVNSNSVSVDPVTTPESVVEEHEDKQIGDNDHEGSFDSSKENKNTDSSLSDSRNDVSPITITFGGKTAGENDFQASNGDMDIQEEDVFDEHDHYDPYDRDLDDNFEFWYKELVGEFDSSIILSDFSSGVSEDMLRENYHFTKEGAKRAFERLVSEGYIKQNGELTDNFARKIVPDLSDILPSSFDQILTGIPTSGSFSADDYDDNLSSQLAPPVDAALSVYNSSNMPDYPAASDEALNDEDEDEYNDEDEFDEDEYNDEDEFDEDEYNDEDEFDEDEAERKFTKKWKELIPKIQEMFRAKSNEAWEKLDSDTQEMLCEYFIKKRRVSQIQLLDKRAKTQIEEIKNDPRLPEAHKKEMVKKLLAEANKNNNEYFNELCPKVSKLEEKLRKLGIVLEDYEKDFDDILSKIKEEGYITEVTGSSIISNLISLPSRLSKFLKKITEGKTPTEKQL